MAKIQTDSLEVGLTIARDVKNSQGQLLIRAGIALQERHLMLLKSWGITEVEIIGNFAGAGTSGVSVSEGEADKGGRMEEIKQALKEKFRHNNLQAPLLAELFELCAARKAKAGK